MANCLVRACYAKSIATFLKESNTEIFGEIAKNFREYDLNALQSEAWEEEISILKNVLEGVGDGLVAFEYSIPRMGKRVDAILIFQNIVFVVEFKVGETEYPAYAKDQVMDYALDLHNFHEASHNIDLFPILVCTEAPEHKNTLRIIDKIAEVICCNKETLEKEIYSILEQNSGEKVVDPFAWLNSPYKPTPTIIEAARALYSGHGVEEITHKSASNADLEKTTKCIEQIIERSKNNKEKSICFVTGVPGAGKTLVGLNVASYRHNIGMTNEGHAVFLSGNGPLVAVLREALTRDRYDTETEKYNSEVIKNKPVKSAIYRETKSFIQIIYLFRNQAVESTEPPVDRIAIFDEAQRAWTQSQLSTFMKTKMGVPNFSMSEPECLIEYMDRHDDWAVVICLVGGGQEINKGEAGIEQWFTAVNDHFRDWHVYYSDQMKGTEYLTEGNVEEKLSSMENKPVPCSELHLAVSMRSFRNEKVSEFAKALIDGDAEQAKGLYAEISKEYPIYLTRNINKAKEWVKHRSRGTERYGIVASSQGGRLRADGVTTPQDLNVEKWFLDGKEDVDSSYGLELAASEFEIQGLEIDYAVVAWEGDYRFNGRNFTFNRFYGGKWQNVNDPMRKKYLKNAYRVLLTRARQGFVIYISKGNPEDVTRKAEYYDETYNYLKGIGIKELN